MKRKRSTETKETEQTNQPPEKSPHLDLSGTQLEKTKIEYFYKLVVPPGKNINPLKIHRCLSRRWAGKNFCNKNFFRPVINELTFLTANRLPKIDKENPSKYGVFLNMTRIFSGLLDQKKKEECITAIITRLKITDKINCDVLLPLLKNKDNTPPLTPSSSSTSDSQISIKPLLPTLKRSSPLHFNPPRRPRPRFSDSGLQASVSIPSQTTSSNATNSHTTTPNSSSTK